MDVEQVLLLVVAVAVVLAVFFDALVTTLKVGDTGPLTRFVLGRAWHLVLRLHRRDSGSALLRSTGPALLFGTVLVWVVLLWAGWSLVFWEVGAVVDAQTSAPAPLVETVYYAGFTVFTLGVGDYVSATSTGRLLTAVAGFSGLFLITLAITYLLSVVSAVVDRRALAARVHTLGDDAQSIVVNGWNGQGFASAFVQHLVSLTGQVTDVAEQHLAYPVLHYFRSRERSSAAPCALVHLDEAMLLLDSGIAPEARPHPDAVEPVRRAIGHYIDTASRTTTARGVPDVPAAPGRALLERAGLPLADERDHQRAVSATAERRRRLRQLLESNGWSWPTAPGDR
ncbi:potassium channel family protein [Kineococcus sp. G2]|uniref:potassium channel family protein n=1 Tax=Kineococcus sp. G2 TaxID=3127484 RepID=UPI00301D5A1E